MASRNKDEYNASSIRVVEGMEHIRMRPRNYLGEEIRDVAAREIIDNAADEVTRGFATAVSLTFHPDGSVEVADNGRGVPPDFDAESGMNGIVKSLGTPRSGVNFDDDTEATAGTNGVGSSATNAISSRFDVTVFRGGKMYRQCFQKGVPGHFTGDDFDVDAEFTAAPGEKLKGVPAPEGSMEHGTVVRFVFDPEIEPENVFHVEDMVHRVNLMARLTPGMQLQIIRDGKVEQFTGPDYGAPAAFEFAVGSTPVLNITGDLTFTRAKRDVPASFDVALAPSSDPKSVSSVNAVWTYEGGSHVSSIEKAVGAGLSQRKVQGLDRENGEPYPEPEDFAAVTTVMMDVRTPNARLVGQEKRKLTDPTLGRALEREVSRRVAMWASSPANTPTLLEWAKLALSHARTKRKIQSVRESARTVASKAGKNTNLALPDKFLPCRATGRGSGAELHLCEGDSALGTIKAARSAVFQSAFPLRGKPLKAYNRTLTKCRENAEFAGIEALLGCGVGDSTDPEKCRFDRIILTTDADTDGYNISASLITTFVTWWRPLVEAGMLYVAIPPLFIVTAGKNHRYYCVDEAARDEVVETLRADGVKGIEVQRCKGLGEMTPADFRDTVMDPKSRTLIQITYDPSDDQTIETVFGNSAERRREWMADKARNGVDAAEVMD